MGLLPALVRLQTQAGPRRPSGGLGPTQDEETPGAEMGPTPRQELPFLGTTHSPGPELFIHTAALTAPDMAPGWVLTAGSYSSSLGSVVFPGFSSLGSVVFSGFWQGSQRPSWMPYPPLSPPMLAHSYPPEDWPEAWSLGTDTHREGGSRHLRRLLCGQLAPAVQKFGEGLQVPGAFVVNHLRRDMVWGPRLLDPRLTL